MNRKSLASYFCFAFALFLLIFFTASPATGVTIDIKPCYICTNCVPDENGNIQYDENGELVLLDGEETPAIEQCADPPAINLCPKGLTAVAVLAEADDFDSVDSASAKFQIDTDVVSDAPEATSVRWSLEDVNLDGMLDLVFHFITQNLAPDDGLIYRQQIAACLTPTVNGMAMVEGCDNAIFFSKGCDKGPKGQNNQNQNQKGRTK